MILIFRRIPVRVRRFAPESAWDYTLMGQEPRKEENRTRLLKEFRRSSVLNTRHAAVAVAVKVNVSPEYRIASGAEVTGVSTIAYRSIVKTVS